MPNTFVQGKTEILKTFSVKGYKSWTAREGVGAQATLYKGKKRVGWVTDEGNGGEVDFRANTVEADNMVREFVKRLPEYSFDDYTREQYGEVWETSREKPTAWQIFTFANVMLEQAEEELQLKKQGDGVNHAKEDNSKS